VVYLLAPFVETFREMIEMRWLWTSPLRLDNHKLVAFLGEEPTPRSTWRCAKRWKDSVAWRSRRAMREPRPRRAGGLLQKGDDRLSSSSDPPPREPHTAPGDQLAHVLRI
jgi:hypothetical protein